MTLLNGEISATETSNNDVINNETSTVESTMDATPAPRERKVHKVGAAKASVKASSKKAAGTKVKGLVALDLGNGGSRKRREGAKLYRIHLTIECNGAKFETTRDWTAADEKEAFSKVRSAVTAFKGFKIVKAAAEIVG